MTAPAPGARPDVTASVAVGELVSFGLAMEGAQKALAALVADNERLRRELADLEGRLGKAIDHAVTKERQRILAIAERLKEPHTGPRSNGAEYAVPLSFLRAELTREPQCDRPDCGQDAEWGTA